VNEITAVEAARLLSEQPEKTVLLDVREAVELEMAAVAGALHIPMGEIPANLGAIDQTKTIICMCRSGGRSAQVEAYLRQQGFEDVHNLTGGINAWSATVDDRIPQY